MFAGHFGLAVGVKAKAPNVPLWALMLGTQLLDLIFVPLYVAGVETIVPVGTGYGANVIHADYTHSLVGALLIACLAGLLAWRRWGRSGGNIIAAVVFSHWILDLLVHRPDIPILPGNWGGLPLLGFGLWKYPTVSILLEGLLIVVGWFMYFRSMAPGANGKRNALSLTSIGVIGLLLGLSLLSTILGIG